MCGRYYVADDDSTEELAAIIAEAQKRSNEQMKLGEIRPTDIAPVIANNRAGKPTSFAMRWGFTYHDALIINARSETAAEKPLFRESIERRRCLIPASYYFEWEKRGKERVKYALGAGKMIYMAGLYRIEENGPVFTVLTREPMEQIAFIHDRMPVILSEEQRSLWLSTGYRPNAKHQDIAGLKAEAV